MAINEINGSLSTDNNMINELCAYVFVISVGETSKLYVL